MPIPNTINGFIEELGIIYDVLPHPKTDSPIHTARAVYLTPDCVAQAHALMDQQGIVVALFPSGHVFDIKAVNRHLKRALCTLEPDDTSLLFEDCRPADIPGLPQAYNIQCILDTSFESQKNIYLPSGSGTDLLCVHSTDLCQVVPEHNCFSYSKPDPKWQQEPHSTGVTEDILDMKKMILKLKKLPAMPEISKRVMQLRSDQNAGTKDLAKIVKLDPSLSAQVIRYARSPIFGYNDVVHTVEDAITKALGFDMVIDMAIGLSVGKSLMNPQEGPLGMRAYWRHSLLCATLTQKLADSLPKDKRPDSGSPYLAGLLHNFGILLLGHLYHKQFYKLNTSLAKQPETPITLLEKQAIGVSHIQLGSWLVQHWDLPDEILVCVREHHKEMYQGDHEKLCYLLQIANRLLRRHGIGDAENITIPSHMLDALGLEEHTAETVLEEVLAGSNDIEKMIDQIAA